MTDATPQPQRRKFFGDAEHIFTLTPQLILELERTTGAGIGKLCERLFARHFDYRDVSEVIRLALIGGGAQPDKAAALVQTYVPAQPLIHSYTLAVDILERLWFGSSDKDTTDENA